MTARESLVESLRRLGLGLIDSTQGRLGLLQTELSTELDRLGSLLARQILLALSAMLTVQFLALVVLASVWDTRWRVTATVILAVLAAGATAFAYRAYQAKKRMAKPIFAGTMHELEKDRRAMERPS